MPFYFKHLGREQWGIVAICITMQEFMMLLNDIAH